MELRTAIDWDIRSELYMVGYYMGITSFRQKHTPIKTSINCVLSADRSTTEFLS
ncbi:MAG: hypothetical protein ACTSRE_00515 [Promethearchaeota archaeon]